MANFSVTGKNMRMFLNTFIKALCALSVSVMLSSCASYDYSKRIVQQGNLLPEKKLKVLHTGMSKEEVAMLMGTSLISPMFNNDRWDYAYTWRKGSGADKIKYVSIYFTNNRVTHIERSKPKTK